MSNTNEKLIQLEIAVLAENDKVARENREMFNKKNMLVLNLVSSPGSGKTTLLCETIKKLMGKVSMTVIEGDQQTVNDAERIRSTGCKALQINTGEGCHLEADMIKTALDTLEPEEKSILFIENVGNLVCPAAFDLGEECKVVVLSVTEGEDKPIKYPDMFKASKVMLLNKIDLLPYVNFDVDKCKEYARRVNPDIEIIELSSTKDIGFEQWTNWLLQNLSKKQNA